MEISRLLDIPHQTVGHAIKRFEETGSNDDRERSGRPVWQAYLQSKACTAPHFSIANLKASLVREWNAIAQSYIQNAIDSFPKRLRKCIAANVDEGRWNRIKTCNCSFLQANTTNTHSALSQPQIAKLHKQSAVNITLNLDYWCNPNVTSNEGGEVNFKGNLTSFVQAIFLCSLHNRTVSKSMDKLLYRRFEAEYLRWPSMKFLFEKDNAQRNSVCQAMENRTTETLHTCHGYMEDSFAKRCKSDKPYDFEWYVLSAFSDVYIINNNQLHDDGTTLFEKHNYSEAWASRLVNFVEESHRFRAVHASVAESFVIGNKLVRQFLTSTLMLNSFGRSVRQTQRLIDNHCSDVSNMEAAPVAKMQMHIECNQSILYARTENTLGVTDLQPLLTAEKFHNFIHLLLLGLGALANIYVYILLQASTASLVPLPGPSSSA
uniref:Uncharacterized protein n=1 Tax=Ditylenchus dipsaci TaxID=166011 RepID=A0A915DCG3_9BILA